MQKTASKYASNESDPEPDSPSASEDEDANSDDEQTFMKETYEKVEMPKEETLPKSKKSKTGGEGGGYDA